jgi:FtsP/CotA-like multicopper oxidase with cupredoxin domain
VKIPGAYKKNLIAGFVVLLSILGFALTSRKGVAIDPFYPVDGEVFQSGVTYEPFTQEVPIPPLKEESEPFEFQCSLPRFEGQKTPKFYQIHVKKGMAEIVPGVQTEIWGYDGIYPGPMFRAFHNEPVIVRFHNELTETITIPHFHGGHQPSESDGIPVVERQLIPQGEFRDFCFPNIAPIEPSTGKEDMGDFPSSMWFHDHSHELGSDTGITGRNVYMGLAGVYVVRDELEQDLIDRRVLPAEDFDIYLAIQDRALDSGGRLIYNPEAVNYDGVLGDIPVVNGKAQPSMRVERRKYRFRMLNGSTARFIQLQLSDGEFIQIGADTWLLPEALTPTASDEEGTRVGEIRLANAERADVIIDFRNAPSEVFLNNILFQSNGRKPDDIVLPGTPIMKFMVEGDPVPLEDDATVALGTPLRPHTAIRADEIVRTRVFKFERTNGHWAINGRFFDHDRVEANPVVGTAERWILENGGGGWAHPIHIHLEAHQIQSLERRAMDAQEKFKKDTIRLQPNERAEIFIKARTFPGRYVFHCHNNEHEDFAMMFRWDVVEEEGLEEARTMDQAQIRAGEAPLPLVPNFITDGARGNADAGDAVTDEVLPGDVDAGDAINEAFGDSENVTTDAANGSIGAPTTLSEPSSTPNP